MISNSNSEKGVVLVELSLVLLIALAIAFSMLEFSYAVRGYMVAQQLSREAANRVLRECSDEFIYDKSRNLPEAGGLSCLDQIRTDLENFLNTTLLNWTENIQDEALIIISVYRRSDAGNYTKSFNYGGLSGITAIADGCGNGHINLITARGATLECATTPPSLVNGAQLDNAFGGGPPRDTIVVGEVYFDTGFTLNLFGSVFNQLPEGMYDATVI